jgi:hypothetical protein
MLVTALRGVPVRSIACGASHSLAATEGGHVWAWGLGDGGQLGIIEDARTDRAQVPWAASTSAATSGAKSASGAMSAATSGAKSASGAGPAFSALGGQRRALPAAYGAAGRAPARRWLPVTVPFFGPREERGHGAGDGAADAGADAGTAGVGLDGRCVIVKGYYYYYYYSFKISIF